MNWLSASRFIDSILSQVAILATPRQGSKLRDGYASVTDIDASLIDRVVATIERPCPTPVLLVRIGARSASVSSPAAFTAATASACPAESSHVCQILADVAGTIPTGEGLRCIDVPTIQAEAAAVR